MAWDGCDVAMRHTWKPKTINLNFFLRFHIFRYHLASAWLPSKWERLKWVLKSRTQSQSLRTARKKMANAKWQPEKSREKEGKKGEHRTEKVVPNGEKHFIFPIFLIDNDSVWRMFCMWTRANANMPKPFDSFQPFSVFVGLSEPNGWFDGRTSDQLEKSISIWTMFCICQKLFSPNTFEHDVGQRVHSIAKQHENSANTHEHTRSVVHRIME